MEETTTPNRPLDLARGDNSKVLDPSLRWDDTPKNTPKFFALKDTLKRAGAGLKADLPRRGFTFEVFALAFLLGILIRSLC